MTYGNDTCEMIESGNKRTFFDSRHFATENLELPPFSEFCKKRKSFDFL